MDIKKYWSAVLRQDAKELEAYFAEDAWVNWHNTNEHFTAEEFIRVNCEYPGDWDGEVEQMIVTPAHIITATHVWSKDRAASHHVTSFIRMKEGKILSVDEYWGDDGEVPNWRKEKKIGSKIKE